MTYSDYIFLMGAMQVIQCVLLLWIIVNQK